MIRRLAHLCLVAFYRDKLGLRVAFTFVNDDGATNPVATPALSLPA